MVVLETHIRLRDAALERIPDSLYAAVVTGPGHDLDRRISGVADLRNALLTGGLPSPHTLLWPTDPLKGKILDWLDKSGLPRYCRDAPDMTDAVILNIIDGVTNAKTRYSIDVERLFRELVAIEEQRRDERESVKLDGKKTTTRWLSQATEDELRRKAEESVPGDQAIRLASSLSDLWGERLRAWSSIEEVFGGLGSMCGLGWDLSPQVLHHTGWQDVERLAELLKQLPHIRDVVRMLGRMQSTELPEDSGVLERLLGSVRRTPDELREIDTPSVPHDTRGVVRSGDIARMLPSEAVLFSRPTLRLLWHAKRAERALITYHVRGVRQDHVVADSTGTDAQEADRFGMKKERGPIIVCLDTSGSMQGAPETIAKAVTLEAVRIGNEERRDCFLYAFSGPSDVIEIDLSVERGGIEGLLEFLGCSFGGGTDVAGPVSRALKRVESDQWSRADTIIVSDGEFPVSADVRESVSAARANLDLRVHGLLIGALHSPAMTSLCDPLHVFNDWDALAAGRAV